MRLLSVMMALTALVSTDGVHVLGTEACGGGCIKPPVIGCQLLRPQDIEETERFRRPPQEKVSKIVQCGDRYPSLNRKQPTLRCPLVSFLMAHDIRSAAFANSAVTLRSTLGARINELSALHGSRRPNTPQKNRFQRVGHVIKSAAFSAIMIVAAFVFARGIDGITEASITRNRSNPLTRN